MKYILLFIKKTLRFVLKPLSFVPAIFVMYMIFRLSAQDGATSSQLSLKVSHKIVVTADKILKKDFTEEQVEHYVKKSIIMSANWDMLQNILFWRYPLPFLFMSTA